MPARASHDRRVSRSDSAPLISVTLQSRLVIVSFHWSISVSGNWRIVFRFDAGDASDVTLVDYH